MDPTNKPTLANRRVLAELERLCTPRREIPPFGVATARDMVVHPEVLQRLWDVLNAALPEDCRGIVYERPVLRHPRTGNIFAFGAGTIYVLRVPTGVLQAIPPDEHRHVQKMWRQEPWDLRQSLEEDWVFGRWRPEEIVWCQRAYVIAAVETN
jgi:hypothetical protein